MSVIQWNTRQPLPAEFGQAWHERLARIPHAHFAVGLEYLIDEARQGCHARLLLIEEGGTRGAMVLREEGMELVSGWPWRWQAMVEGADPADPRGMSVEQSEWLWQRAQEQARGQRLRFHLPTRALNGTPWFQAGNTYYQPLDKGENDLWMGMDGAKRRMVKKAKAQGFTIVEARDLELLRQFSRLPREDERATAAAGEGELPAEGKGWREWELPWMWLLVAVRNGAVEAGSGFGLYPGASIDYRTNASVAVAKKDGANVLLAWEAMRLSHERGLRWINWGGATRFKQEFGGTKIEVDCRLGGGPAWWLPNLVDVSSRHARVRIGTWAKKRAKRAAETKTARASATKIARGADAAAISVWRTRQPLDPAFETRWQERLAKVPRANFGFDLAYLAWEARHDRHAMVAMADEGERGGLLVMREAPSGWVCGWPWRWLAAMVEPANPASPMLEPADAVWLHRQAERLAAGKRLHFYTPVAPPPGIASFEAGATIVQALDRTDEELLASIHPSKRRMVKRAQNEGYHVIEGETLEHFRTFAAIQREAFQRRGIHIEGDLDKLPEPGEDWREWELPWMWLLLAVRDGRVESGLGDGLGTSGMLEGRTGASTALARRAGAFALLCYEEARRGRDRGYRWLNHGGDTPFKREMAGALGTRLVMHCWLGGGSAWKLANRSEAWARSARLRAPALWRTFRAKGMEPS